MAAPPYSDKDARSLPSATVDDEEDNEDLGIDDQPPTTRCGRTWNHRSRGIHTGWSIGADRE
jgi:hypothetical protein